MQDILILIVTYLIQTSILVCMVVLSILNRKQFKITAVTGTLAALVTLFLGLPLQILILKSLDITGIVTKYADLPLRWNMVEPIIYIIIIFVGFVSIIISAGFVYFSYLNAYAEWNRIKKDGFPLLQFRESTDKQKKQSGIHNLISGGIGIVLAVISLLALSALHVGESREMENLYQFIPGLFGEPQWVQLSAFALFAVSAAVTEEIVFRGMLLGFFVRITGNRFVFYMVASIIVAAAWAFLHYHNTNAPVIKLVQVFGIGLVLSELCRRWSLESAIALHVVFNISSIFLEPMLTQ